MHVAPRVDLIRPSARAPSSRHSLLSWSPLCLIKINRSISILLLTMAQVDIEQEMYGSWILSNKHREWVFYAICLARSQLQQPVLELTLTNETIARAIAILDRASGHTGMLRLPSRNTVRSIWDCFRNESSTIDISQRKRVKFDEAILISRVESVLREHPEASSHQITTLLPEDTPGRSQSTVWRLLTAKMNLNFYRRRKVQVLSDQDFLARKAFARRMIDDVQRNVLKLTTLIVSDEMMISLNPHFNRQNDGRWQLKGQQDRVAQLVTRKAFAKSIHMWVGLNWHTGIIGPFFIDEIDAPHLSNRDRGKSSNSLTGAKYKLLIEESIMPEIYMKVPEHVVKREFWWQQDGAGPHVSAAPLALLRSIFGERILSRKTNYAWPARSPDLNPLDFSFWALMRKHISSLQPKNLIEIKYAARDAVAALEPYVKRIIADMPIRLRACLESEGRHFEPWLKEYKRRVIKAGVCAKCSMDASGNLCGTCGELLFQCRERDNALAAEQNLRDEESYEDDDDDVMENISAD